VSYKRADEERVGQLVRALARAGLSVWWDRNLPGGEHWRPEIQAALDVAGCVIVVWTHHSVGSSADFVHDEAAYAKRRGILVPVLMDDVHPPLGFGEIQSLDFRYWNGREHDPLFHDLVAAVHAKLDGRPVPPATAPTTRVARRVALGSVVMAALSLSGVFGANVFSVQDRMCAAGILQPYVSDACGAAGLGRRPTRLERIAWAERELGSCAALRTHLERFPNGVFRDVATSLIAARRLTRSEVWNAATHTLTLFVPQGDDASGNEALAREEALRRAQPAAEQLCKGFTATKSFKFRAATPLARTWNCGVGPEGARCGFEGEAICQLDEQVIQEGETCGDIR
jgi:hypothetical protein